MDFAARDLYSFASPFRELERMERRGKGLIRKAGGEGRKTPASSHIKSSQTPSRPHLTHGLRCAEDIRQTMSQLASPAPTPPPPSFPLAAAQLRAHKPTSAAQKKAPSYVMRCTFKSQLAALSETRQSRGPIASTKRQNERWQKVRRQEGVCESVSPWRMTKCTLPHTDERKTQNKSWWCRGLELCLISQESSAAKR